MIGILNKNKMIVAGVTINDLLEFTDYDDLIIKNNIIYISKEMKKNENELE